MSILRRFSEALKRYRAGWYALAGSFIISSGWGYYHFSKHNIPKLVLMIGGIAFVLYTAYQLGKIFYVYVARRLGRHSFWHNEFVKFLDELFFVASLFFIIFFFQSEVISAGYVLAVLLVLYWRTKYYLKQHPDAAVWLTVHKNIFGLAFFVFLLQVICQYTAYHYYILDSNIRYFNIVIFRAVAMTSFWLAGFCIASILYGRIKNRLRTFFMLAWSVLFSLSMFFWLINIGILYYSGLYLSPSAIDHFDGSTSVLENNLTYLLLAACLLVLVVFVYLMRAVIRAHKTTQSRYWNYYTASILFVSFFLMVGLSSFKNTPERTVLHAFYNRSFGKEQNAVLSPELQKKLERFGLFYKTQDFAVAHKETVFSPSSTLKLLPDRLVQKKPNIAIVFLESFSARLTSVYDDRFADVTPNFTKMAQDPHTTVFRNYYNASTPTITGTLSQLCSFLPPFGHNEIQNERKLQNHHLLCLPQMLKNYAGFGYAGYVTAVDKEFAHKDGIFTSMGVDKIFGTSELKKYIPAEPMSWGYSDHQMFPVLGQMMDEKAKDDKPFLLMLASVDTHPPFNLAKDAVNYGDGSEPVLNMFHTTDDAFGKFWENFKQSPRYNDTILITVADHAIFPAALTKDLFPKEASSLTYYDQNMFMMYVPDSVLPKEVATYASGLNLAPSILHMLNINKPNSFDGRSIFDDQKNYPNILGMHELGLYINEVVDKNGKRKVSYDVPDNLTCDENTTVSSTAPLTLCEFLHFYKWKRQMFEEGRLWDK